MKPLPLRARYLAIVLVACAFLGGCTTSHHPPSPGIDSAAPGPGEGEVVPSATTPPSPSPTTEPDLKNWPKHPASADRFPHSIRSTVVAKGYTGTAFLQHLTRQWHITLSPRQKYDFKKDDGQPAVWLSTGAAHPSAGTELSVAVVWNLSGDIESLACSADRKAPGHTDFLRDCIKLDHPGSNPIDATHWLDEMIPETDKAQARAKGPVGSPLYRAGRAASFLQEYDNGAEGVKYTVRIIGTSS